MRPNFGAMAVIGAVLPCITFGTAAAEPRQRIGATLSVINVVTAEFNRDTRTLLTGDGVHQNELIDVSQDASTELKLNDDTKLALGPGAKLKLDKFVYDGEKSTSSIGVDLVQGAFRFITGVAAKPSYVIKVPSASITVRGTIFDVYVADNDSTWLLLHEGAVRVCNARGTCRDHAEPGKVLKITDKGDLGAPIRWAGLKERDGFDFDVAFPFVAKPPTIDPNPIFTRDDLIRRAAIEPEKKPDLPRKGKTTKQTKKSEPEKTKRSAKTDQPKPVKVTAPKPASKPKDKPVRTTQKQNDDAAAKAAIGLAVGIGLGLAIGKGGKGGKPNYNDSPARGYKPN
jgi:hypothetical protein